MTRYGNYDFLIVGCGRGGTSLLNGMLDMNPLLESSFEKFSYVLCRRKKKEKEYHPKSTNDEVFQDFLECCLKDSQKYPEKIWGNKITTEQIFLSTDTNFSHYNQHEECIRKFFDICVGDRKLIFILRDGTSCIASKAKRANISFLEACNRWLFFVEVYKFLKDHRAQNTKFIRFEDLLVNPEKELRQLSHFLDIPYSANMLNGYKNEKMPQSYKYDSIKTSRRNACQLPQEYIKLIANGMAICQYALEEPSLPS